jgi:predicted RNA binding protein YcfA (HicA-like mRNA interferase family)
LKLPRSVSGSDVIRVLERADFRVLRQEGSHVRLCRGALRVTVPLHAAVAPGTLKAILRQCGITVDEFIEALK